MVLEAGSIDIAELLYSRGLRLSKVKQIDNVHEDVEDEIWLLVRASCHVGGYERTTNIAHVHSNLPETFVSILTMDMIDLISRSL